MNGIKAELKRSRKIEKTRNTKKRKASKLSHILKFYRVSSVGGRLLQSAEPPQQRPSLLCFDQHQRCVRTVVLRQDRQI